MVTTAWSARIALPMEKKLNSHIPDSFIKDTLQVALSQSWALQVLVSSNLLCNNERLVIGYGFHSLLFETLQGIGILSKIKLGTDQDDGNWGSMMIDFGIPLLFLLAFQAFPSFSSLAWSRICLPLRGRYRTKENGTRILWPSAHCCKGD